MGSEVGTAGGEFSREFRRMPELSVRPWAKATDGTSTLFHLPLKHCTLEKGKNSTRVELTLVVAAKWSLVSFPVAPAQMSEAIPTARKQTPHFLVCSTSYRGRCPSDLLDDGKLLRVETFCAAAGECYFVRMTFAKASCCVWFFFLGGRGIVSGFPPRGKRASSLA